MNQQAKLINELGYKGMTLTKVAQAIDLNTTSITYYFKRKELLASAVLERSLERIEALIEDAARGRTPQERIARYIRSNFELQAAINAQEERPVAVLSDIRAQVGHSGLAHMPTDFCFLFRGHPLDPTVEDTIGATRVAVHGRQHARFDGADHAACGVLLT